MDLSTAVQTIERIGKRGHDGIANGLDGRPIIFAYRFLQYGKMLSSQMIGLGAADLFDNSVPPPSDPYT